MTIQVHPGRLRWLLSELTAAGVNVLGVERAPDGSMRVTVDPVDGDAARTVAQEVTGYVPRGRLVASTKRVWRINVFDLACGAAVLSFGVLAVVQLWGGGIVGGAFFLLLAGVTAVLGPRYSNADKRARQALRDAGIARPLGMRIAGWFDNAGFILGAALLLAVAIGAVWFAITHGALQ